MVSVLCRMAFDFGLWSDGAAPLLFVCEEAHRYAPADKKIGFGPTRRALSRIAKEGRKYGVFLGLVTQRPAEIDSDHHLAVLDAVRHAAGQRPRPAADPLGGVGRRRQSAVVHPLARHPRSVHLRLGRGAADAHALSGIAARAAPEQRGLRQHPLRRRQQRRQRADRRGDRALAQRQHEPPRRRRRPRLRLAARHAAAAGGAGRARHAGGAAALAARRSAALQPAEEAARCQRARRQPARRCRRVIRRAIRRPPRPAIRRRASSSYFRPTRSTSADMPPCRAPSVSMASYSRTSSDEKSAKPFSSSARV